MRNIVLLASIIEFSLFEDFIFLTRLCIRYSMAFRITKIGTFDRGVEPHSVCLLGSSYCCGNVIFLLNVVAIFGKLSSAEI